MKHVLFSLNFLSGSRREPIFEKDDVELLKLPKLAPLPAEEKDSLNWLMLRKCAFEDIVYVEKFLV
jgi:hypothetical protein